MKNNTFVGKDIIDLVVDVNGCHVFAVVFCFCDFLHLFCAWRLFVERQLPGYWLFGKTSPPKARGG